MLIAKEISLGYFVMNLHRAKQGKKGLDPSKPVHLFGAGHPLIFPLAVALGCDLFDSSAYVKYANDGRMIFHWGTEIIQEGGFVRYR